MKKRQKIGFSDDNPVSMNQILFQIDSTPPNKTEPIYISDEEEKENSCEIVKCMHNTILTGTTIPTAIITPISSKLKFTLCGKRLREKEFEFNREEETERYEQKDMNKRDM